MLAVALLTTTTGPARGIDDVVGDVAEGDEVISGDEIGDGVAAVAPGEGPTGKRHWPLAAAGVSVTMSWPLAAGWALGAAVVVRELVCAAGHRFDGW